MATAAQNKKKSMGNKLQGSDDLLLTILNQIQADIRKLDGKIDDNIRELKADIRKLDGKVDDNIRELNRQDRRVIFCWTLGIMIIGFIGVISIDSF